MLPDLLRKKKKKSSVCYVHPTSTQIVAYAEGQVSPEHVENNKLADHCVPAG